MIQRTVYLSITIACICFANLDAATDADLLRLASPIVDMHLLPSGGVRLYTQQLEVFDADPTEGVWKRRSQSVGGALVRRVSQVLRSGNTVLAFGQIVTYDAAASVVLRSTDLGASFTPVLVGTDTLAISDGCSRSPLGALYFIDRIGRLWTSADDGVTWLVKRLPVSITPGSAREVDMIDANTGVCVDGIRGVHFTTDAWATLISPIPAKRPITRTQPSMINSPGWVRNFVLLNNMLYLTEAGDIYRTPSNDLIWERWDSVAAFTSSVNRKQIAYYTVDGKLVLQNANGTNYRVVSTDALPPHLLRVENDTIIAYRPDTGPVIYAKGQQVFIRPLSSERVISGPTIQATNSSWGILTNTVDAVLVDILKKDGKGLWHRDTVAAIGPVRNLYTVGADTVVFTTNGRAIAYVPSKRTLTPYEIRSPLASFINYPIVRFRILFASDELDSTHVKWVEYSAQGSELVCAELVDSSRFGVRSQLISHRFTQDEIMALLRSINDRGEDLPGSDFVQVTPDVRREFSAIVDTLFSTDAYFDPFDAYKPPPAAEDQARVCRDLFMQVVDELPKLSTETIAQAMRSFRHVPHDGNSRYVIEFQNRSGRIARFMVDRIDEAHPPLMLPWRGYTDGRMWRTYDRGLPCLFTAGLPDGTVPRTFIEMSHDSWFLIGVASYLDAIRYGRRHRWSNRIITPAAKY